MDGCLNLAGFQLDSFYCQSNPRSNRPNSAAGPVATAASRPSQVAAGRAGPAACGGGHLAPRGGRKKRNSRDRTSRVFMWRRTWNDPAKNCPMQMNWLRFTPMTMMQDSVRKNCTIRGPISSKEQLQNNCKNRLSRELQQGRTSSLRCLTRSETSCYSSHCLDGRTSSFKPA